MLRPNRGPPRSPIPHGSYSEAQSTTFLCQRVCKNRNHAQQHGRSGRRWWRLRLQAEEQQAENGQSRRCHIMGARGNAAPPCLPRAHTTAACRRYRGSLQAACSHASAIALQARHERTPCPPSRPSASAPARCWRAVTPPAPATGAAAARRQRSRSVARNARFRYYESDRASPVRGRGASATRVRRRAQSTQPAAARTAEE